MDQATPSRLDAWSGGDVRARREIVLGVNLRWGLAKVDSLRVWGQCGLSAWKCGENQKRQATIVHGSVESLRSSVTRLSPALPHPEADPSTTPCRTEAREANSSPFVGSGKSDVGQQLDVGAGACYPVTK